MNLRLFRMMILLGGISFLSALALGQLAYAEDEAIEDSICQGDFDCDGDVDGADLDLFAGEYGRTDCTDCGVGVSGYEILTADFFTGNGVGREALTPTCPAGKVAISGGIQDTGFPITVQNSRDFNVAAIHPSGSTRWRARWFNGTGQNVNVRLFTVCLTGN